MCVIAQIRVYLSFGKQRSMKKILFLVFMIFYTGLYAQVDPPRNGKNRGDGLNIRFNDTIPQRDSIKTKIKIFPVKDYKIFTLKYDTIHVDTILNIKKHYTFNELLQDDFLQLKLHNNGQAVNALSFVQHKDDILPGFVASAKYTDFWTHEQVPFFLTPSPYSDISYLNGVSQGQMLNAVFATNINPHLNTAVGYRGLSSLGLYKRSVVNSGRFFGSADYHSKSNKYFLKFYYFTYQKDNEENGGIKEREQFENGGEVFKDRSRIDVNLMDAESNTKHHRLFIGQEYRLLDNKIHLINNILYRSEMFQFTEAAPNTLLFGEAQTTSAVNDSIYRKVFENFSGVQFQYKSVELETGLRYIYQFYSTDSLKVIGTHTYPKFLEYYDMSWDSKAKFKLDKFLISSQLDVAFTENLAGYYLQAETKYNFNEELSASAELISASTRPDMKFILYQSAYNKYNWYHPEYKNELSQQVKLQINHNKYGRVKLQQNIVNYYTYFGLDSLPHQDKTGIKYTGLTYSKDWHAWKLGLSTDIHLQKVLDGKEILSLPSYVFRSSLYFSDYYYTRNLFVQTGFTFKYFDAYYAPAYHPVMGDFVLQNRQKIGAYPVVDYFFNFKVKRFRFFFKLEHLNALLEYQTPTYYAAPLQPTRDFSVRFGLRWIWFN